MSDETRELRVAACQLATGENFDDNLEQIERALELAAADGARLAVLPELIDFMGDDPEALAHAVQRNSEVGSLIAARAQALGLWVVGGSTHAPAGDGQTSNTSRFYSPDGVEVGRYSKLHMFDVELDDGFSYRESEHTRAGDGLSTVEVDGHRVSTAICYDLRFPELFRIYGLGGTEILALPAAFTAHTGAAHWEVLIRARAIENQFFMIAAGQIGEYAPNGRSYGHSMVVDPWGRVLDVAPDRAVSIASATLKLSMIEELRGQLPATTNRRTDLYRLEWLGNAEA